MVPRHWTGGSGRARESVSNEPSRFQAVKYTFTQSLAAGRPGPRPALSRFVTTPEGSRCALAGGLATSAGAGAALPTGSAALDPGGARRARSAPGTVKEIKDGNKAATTPCDYRPKPPGANMNPPSPLSRALALVA